MQRGLKATNRVAVEKVILIEAATDEPCPLEECTGGESGWIGEEFACLNGGSLSHAFIYFAIERFNKWMKVALSLSLLLVIS